MRALLVMVGLAVAAPSAGDLGAVSVRAGSGSIGRVFQASSKQPLLSATSVVEDLTEGCRFLTVCLSSLSGVDCTTAQSVTVPEGEFVLTLGVRLPVGAAVQPGRLKDLGLILRTAQQKYSVRSKGGVVTITDTTLGVAGTLDVAEEQLQVSGTFVATEPSTTEPSPKPPRK